MSDLSSFAVFPQSLEAYNAGMIVGNWVDPCDFDDFEDFEAQVKKVTKNAEEIMIADYNGSISSAFGEYPNLTEYFEFVSQVKASSIDENILLQFASNQHYQNLLDIVSDAEDSFLGSFDNMREFAWHWAEMQYPEFYNHEFFDIESYEHSLQNYGYLIFEDDWHNVYIFSEC